MPQKVEMSTCSYGLGGTFILILVRDLPITRKTKQNKTHNKKHCRVAGFISNIFISLSPPPLWALGGAYENVLFTNFSILLATNVFLFLFFNGPYSSILFLSMPITTHAHINLK